LQIDHRNFNAERQKFSRISVGARITGTLATLKIRWRKQSIFTNTASGLTYSP
jgi:hypothetical protein